MKKIVAVASIMLAVLVYVGIEFGLNRIWVPQGMALMLRYKGGFTGSPDAKGLWAEQGEKGVMRELKGSGVHFYSPFFWQRTIVDELEIKPGEVGVVTVKVGKDAPAGEFIVEGDILSAEFKGVLRKVLGPGRYRVNPFGFEVKILETAKVSSGNTEKTAGWVLVPPGYVAVATHLVDNEILGTKVGVDDNVYQAGLYLVNPKETLLDLVEVGYRHTDVKTQLKTGQNGLVAIDENGEPQIAQDDSGIQFPSTDGFGIHEDYSAIWGLLPKQAPKAIRTIGNVDMIEQKIILPQISSVLRTSGSENKAADFLSGEKRLSHQREAEQRLHEELDKKDISLLYGLVKAVYVPREVREPIQKSFIAEEEKLTKVQKQATAKVEALLRSAEKEVELATQKVSYDTNKLVAQKTAEGTRKAAVTDAETKAKVAAIDLKTAELEAQANLIQGEAEAKAKQLMAEAEAELFGLAVDAFGSPEAYNAWVFATGLPEEMKINVIYAGEGTLWTDRSNLNIQAVVPGSQGK